MDVGIAAKLTDERGRIGTAICAAIVDSSPSVVISCAGARHVLIAEATKHFVVGQLFEVERQGTGQQFVKHRTERVDVGADVDVLTDGVCLLGAHVAESSNERADAREHGFSGELLRGCLGHAEVDDARHGLAVDLGDQDVRGLEVAVDDSLLVGVLDAFADLDEEFHTFANGEPVPVAVVR